MGKEIISVDKSVKRIPESERKVVELVLGKEYFVHIGQNKVVRCTLTEIHEEGEGNKKRITVSIPYIHKASPRYLSMAGSSYLYADEIGNTPEEAVKHSIL